MASKHHQEDPWAGFVDVLANMLVVVVFLVIVLGLAIFALSQQITKNAVEQALEQQKEQQEKKESPGEAKTKGDQVADGAATTPAPDAAAEKPAAAAEAKAEAEAKPVETAKAEAASGEAETKSADTAKAQAAAGEAETKSAETAKAQAAAGEAEAKPVETAKAENAPGEATAGKPDAAAAEPKQGKEETEKGPEDAGTGGPAAQAALEDVTKPADGADTAKGSAGEREAGYAQRVRADDEIEGNSNLTVRSANVKSEEKLEVASEEIKPTYGKIEVKSADAFLKLTFGKGNFRIDNGTTEKLKEYLGSAPLSKDDTIEVRAIAQSTVGSISEARRIAYYRAMETRSQLIQAGFDSTRIIVKVRESVSPEDMDVVQVFKKS